MPQLILLLVTLSVVAACSDTTANADAGSLDLASPADSAPVRDAPDHDAPAEDSTRDGPGDDAAPVVDFKAHAVLLLGPIDFEGEATGLFGLTKMKALFAPWSDGFKMASNAYRADVPSSKHPHIVAYAYKRGAAPLQSKGLQLTMVKDLGNLKYIPANFRIKIPDDPKNTDVYLSFNIKYPDATAWRNTDKTYEWKINGLFAGLNKDLDVKSIPTGYGFVKMKSMGKGVSTGTFQRYVTYPSAGFQSTYIIQTLSDPDQPSSPFLLAIPDQVVHNVTVRVVLGDIGVANGFLEWFINGKLSHRIDSWSGKPIMLRDQPIVINGINLSYHWGGSPDEAPVGSDASLIYDDIVLFRYKPSFAGAQLGKKSAVGRTLSLPNYDAMQQYKSAN